MRKLSVLILVLVLVATSVGCGGSSPDPADNGQTAPGDAPAEDPVAEDPAAPDEEGPLVTGSLVEVNDLRDLIDKFAVLEYSWGAEGHAGDSVHVLYQYVGTDQVDGQAVDHVKITFTETSSESVMEFWTDADGDTVKVMIDGEELPAMMASMGEMYLAAVLLPFVAYGSMWTDLFTEEEGYKYAGLVLEKKQSTTRDLGSGPVPITSYEFTASESVMVGGEAKKLRSRYEVATLNGFHMFAGWEVEVTGEQKITLTVTRAQLR